MKTDNLGLKHLKRFICTSICFFFNAILVIFVLSLTYKSDTKDEYTNMKKNGAMYKKDMKNLSLTAKKSFSENINYNEG